MIYLWIYYGSRFKDFYLPEQKNWTGELILHADASMDRDIAITVRALDGQWYICAADGFSWQDQPPEVTELTMENGQRMVMRRGGMSVGVIISEYQRNNAFFTKYVFLRGETVRIGRNIESHLVLDSPLITYDHGRFERALDGSCAYTDMSRNGTYVNGELILMKSQNLSFGDNITVAGGLKTVYLGDVLAVNHPPILKGVTLCPADMAGRGSSSEVRDEYPVNHQYHRAPRLLQRPDGTSVDIEPPLPKSGQPGIPLLLTIGPSLTMVLPMLMGAWVSAARTTGGQGYLSSGLTMIGTSAALAAMWAVVNYRYRKQQGKQSEHIRTEMYRMYVSETETRLKGLNEKEKRRLLTNFLSAEQCADLVNMKNHRLWERMPTHADFLMLRVGLGQTTLPNEIHTQQKKLSIIDDPLRDEPKRLVDTYGLVKNAPITINLLKSPIIGILGGKGAFSAAQAMILQLAALHSYHDVKIALLTEESDVSRWAFARWLPHVFDTEDRKLRMVASKPSSVRVVLAYLEDVLLLRKEIKGQEQTEAPFLPHYVVICTNPALMESYPALRHILSRPLGMTLVTLSPDMELLPKECDAILNTLESPGAIYTAQGDVTRLEVDYPPAGLVTIFARELAPLRVRDAAESAAIPVLVTFLETYGVRSVDDLDIWRFWNENHTWDGIRSAVGFRAGSQPFVLDISDKYHGPHGLVAGTTGSGKSVMLQTYILSLALNYHPQEIQFILIDYKGGGMADAFKTMPHMVGIIDNLQGERTILRALASIQGEIHRREALFKQAGVNNIDEYNRTCIQNPLEEALSHLIIVVDEFAELKREQSDFMHELVSASRVGRSVGLHLILATQKPSNSVDDEIWSNTRFRICLRVQGRSDSIDMLKRPDAAYIKGMGRCYIQVGNDEIFEQVQTCWSGARYNPSELQPEEMPRMLNDIGQPLSLRKKRRDAGQRDLTQMDAVLGRIAQVVEEHRVPHARPLWLEEIDAHLFLEQLPPFTQRMYRDGHWPEDTQGELMAYFALADDVAGQRYIPLSMDLMREKHHAVVGPASSGKTTALQTVAMSLACRYSPEFLQMYVFSLSSQALSCLNMLPHVGDVVFREEEAEQARLLRQIFRENERRKRLFALASTDSFAEYKNSCHHYPGLEPVPAIVVFIDRLRNLLDILEAFEEESLHLAELIREGSSRGIFFVVSALAVSEIPLKLRDSFRGVALRHSDRGDYQDVLGLRLPSDMPAIAVHSGRGIALIHGEPYEIQVALFGDSASDGKRALAIHQLGLAMREAWRGALPASVLRIPQSPSWEALLQMPACLEAAQDPWLFPIAYDALEGLPVMLSLEKEFSWLILGSRRSGKTTLITGIAKAFLKRGALVYAAGIADLGDFAGQERMNIYDVRLPEWEACVTRLDKLIRERSVLRKQAQKNGPEALDQLVRAFEPVVIILDDLEEILLKSPPAANVLLAQCAVQATKFGVFLFASVSHQGVASVRAQGLYTGLVSQQRGIALGGRLSDCDPWNVQLPFAQRNAQLKPGEAYMIQGTAVRKIVLPGS